MNKKEMEWWHDKWQEWKIAGKIESPSDAYSTICILADIARQLTIANEIATRRHQIEYALAFQQNGKINYEVDSPIDLDKPTPPDALVEAAELIASMECGIHHPGGVDAIPCGVCVRMKEIAKAAHEKAVQ